MKTLLAALLLSTSAMAQPALKPQDYDPHETYYFERQSGSYIHPKDGSVVILVVVRAATTGTYYRVPMRPEDADTMAKGDEVVVVSQKNLRDDLWDPIP